MLLYVTVMFYQLLNSALRDSEFRCHAKVPNHFDLGKMKARRLGLIKTSMPSQPRHIPFLQLGLMPRVGRLVEPAAAGRGRGYTHGSGHSHVWFLNFMVRFKGAIQVMIYDDPGGVFPPFFPDFSGEKSCEMVWVGQTMLEHHCKHQRSCFMEALLCSKKIHNTCCATRTLGNVGSLEKKRKKRLDWTMNHASEPNNGHRECPADTVGAARFVASDRSDQGARPDSSKWSPAKQSPPALPRKPWYTWLTFGQKGPVTFDTFLCPDMPGV